MSPSSSSIAHQVQCDDIWPFDELTADGEMDPTNRLASSELSKNDEIDQDLHLERERGILQMIQDWLSSASVTSSYGFVD